MNLWECLSESRKLQVRFITYIMRTHFLYIFCPDWLKMWGVRMCSFFAATCTFWSIVDWNYWGFSDSGNCSYTTQASSQPLSAYITRRDQCPWNLNPFKGDRKNVSFKNFCHYLCIFTYFAASPCFGGSLSDLSLHRHKVIRFECIPFEKCYIFCSVKDPSRTQTCFEAYRLGPVWAYGLIFVQLGCCTARPVQDIYLVFDIWGFQSYCKKRSWQRETAGSKTAAIFIFFSLLRGFWAL